MSSNEEGGNSPTHSSGSRQSDSTPRNDQPVPADPVNGDDTSSTENSDGNFNTKDFAPIDAPNIRRQALHEGKSVSNARNYGPRELDKGTIASPERTITVFIPLATQTASTQRFSKVLYQPDKDKAEVRQLLPWDVGNHIQIPGNSRIVVEEGPVCFDMVQYDWEPAKSQESKDE
ncbi:hypothetical protein BFJ63_vAg16744 [Fusarium oxysporum f. sp. narcissi]|uniref:Uncharacterized protein n=1 Tax=Fusarium oxysporum f. sp. narcissi TaxID=451672 RepID=A0A4Q2V8S7_FUSOX|nr:hypothetical protein BFJ63_vAg16744 [Fusarium oxysporum f. sp. narcissi]